eukprot:266525-Alexandrium_andersonii.AAC.1
MAPTPASRRSPAPACPGLRGELGRGAPASSTGPAGGQPPASRLPPSPPRSRPRARKACRA